MGFDGSISGSQYSCGISYSLVLDEDEGSDFAKAWKGWDEQRSAQQIALIFMGENIMNEMKWINDACTWARSKMQTWLISPGLLADEISEN